MVIILRFDLHVVCTRKCEEFKKKKEEKKDNQNLHSINKRKNSWLTCVTH